MSTGLRILGIAAAAMMMAAGAGAQTSVEPVRWRIGASTGGYVPFSSLIRASDLNDTELSTGPAFSLESQYVASEAMSVYVNAFAAFGSIRLGSSIRPSVVGPSNTVVLAGTTAGVMVAATDWFSSLQPTLRLGGGIKSYTFDLTDADGQIRPTADIGVGFRGVAPGAIEVTAEVRYLPSTFDQSKLPTRGITTQNQRQNDLLFSIGIAIH